MARTRYFFDKKELVYKEMRLSFARRLLRFLSIFIFSLILAVAYGVGFKHFFGSPKEKKLQSELDEIKYKYNLLDKDFDRIDRELAEVVSVEDNVYRPVFNMEKIPPSFRQSGFGGTRKYTELEGYENSELIVSATRSVDELLRKIYIQSRSFEEIIPVASEWKDSISHIPFVRPVNVDIPLGDGLKYREKHPVLGSPQWHYGQDFTAPSGTEVFVTGDGVVSRAGWNPYGFGNMVEVDHAYGFKTIYGHLSDVKVSRGTKVKRGDLIGLSGNTGVSSGPHLHYEIHYNGRVQNPLYFFDDDLTMDEYNRMIDVFHEGTR
ncbi:MAG: M23 family metallopeptidase [Bacteroidales bacterium]